MKFCSKFSVHFWPVLCFEQQNTVYCWIISLTKFNAQFFYSLTICLLHYYPRHVSSIKMSIFRRKNCIHTASGIFALCRRLHSTLVLLMNKENCALKLVNEIILYYDARSKKHQITVYCVWKCVIVAIFSPCISTYSKFKHSTSSPPYPTPLCPLLYICWNAWRWLDHENFTVVYTSSF